MYYNVTYYKYYVTMILVILKWHHFSATNFPSGKQIKMRRHMRGTQLLIAARAEGRVCELKPQIRLDLLQLFGLKPIDMW